jgi:predicted phage tail protein
MLSTIRVYGRIARFLKRRVFRAEVSSAGEAVRFLLANFPHLEPELAQGHYRVTVGDYDLGEDEIGHPSGQQEIRIIPVVAGAGAAGRIIAGIALIGASFLFPGAGMFGATSIFGATAGTGILTATGTLLSGIGASLVLGGVSQLLTPVPRLPQGQDTQDDPRKSYSFSGIQNVSRSGVPVPIVYGRTLVGSVTISAGIDSVQVTA